MSEQKIKIPRASDNLVFEVFKSICQRYGITKAHVNAFGDTRIGHINLTADPTGDWKALLDYKSTLIETMQIAIDDLVIAYARGGRVDPHSKSPIYDEIIFTNNANTSKPTNEDRLAIISEIHTKFCPFDSSNTNVRMIPQEERDILAIHTSTLQRLQELSEELFRDGLAFREQVENKFTLKVQSVESEYIARKATLDDEHKNRLDQIARREKDIEDKLKLIDDRSNTHVRRQIRENMLNDVKARIQQFGVSKTTADKRTPVAIGIAVLVISIIGLLSFTGYEITLTKSDNTIPYYFLWTRATLLSFGLLGTILYYVKWQNSWASKHADSEFSLQQFYLDVNRSNWVIESCLEWKKDTGSQFPKALISSITNNLFATQESHAEKVIHPADELASALLGSASKLKLRVGDNELEFDKPNKLPNGITIKKAEE